MTVEFTQLTPASVLEQEAPKTAQRRQVLWLEVERSPPRALDPIGLSQRLVLQGGARQQRQAAIRWRPS